MYLCYYYYYYTWCSVGRDDGDVCPSLREQVVGPAFRLAAAVAPRPRGKRERKAKKKTIDGNETGKRVLFGCLKKKKKKSSGKKIPAETTTQNVTVGPTEGRGRSAASCCRRARTDVSRGMARGARSDTRPAMATVQPTIGRRIGGKFETAATIGRLRAREITKKKINNTSTTQQRTPARLCLFLPTFNFFSLSFLHNNNNTYAYDYNYTSHRRREAVMSSNARDRRDGQCPRGETRRATTTTTSMKSHAPSPPLVFTTRRRRHNNNNTFSE